MRYGSLTVEIEFTAGVWTDVTADVQLRDRRAPDGHKAAD